MPSPISKRPGATATISYKGGNGSADPAVAVIRIHDGKRVLVSRKSPDPPIVRTAARIGRSALPLLSLSGLTVRYGAIQAVRGIELAIEAGEVVAVLGANGRRQVDTLKAIVGLVPWGGEIRFDGEALAGRATEQESSGRG